MGHRYNVSKLSAQLSGRNFYAHLYSDSLEYEAEWLQRTAAQKADSICHLINQQGLNPSNILEVGCGTGAVLYELQKRGISKSYYGIDYSTDAISYVHKVLPNVHAIAGDVNDCSQLFHRKRFDLIICAHVLEHLEDPQQLLETLDDLQWNYFYAEVPLEDLFFGKLKSRFQDREKHPSGHVQFFNKKQFLDLIHDSGLKVIKQNLYAPIFSLDTIKFRYGGDSYFRYIYKIFTEYFFPKYFKSFYTKYYHAHMAVLCKTQKQ